jgi:hypothetical protein
MSIVRQLIKEMVIMVDVMFGANCFICNSRHTSPKVTNEELVRYGKGELVQNVWPDMGIEDREIIVGSRTGFYMCSTCWEEEE